MSQTVAPIPAPGAVAPIPGPDGTAVPAAGTDALGRPLPPKEKRLSTTPDRMRLVLVIGVIAGVLFGLAGLQAGTLQSAATANANTESAQLVGVQNIRNNLVRADAIAANAFLVGGLEPVAQRAQYDTAIKNAADLIATLSASYPADAKQLSTVSAQLSVYTGLIEQARANNRQGFPVGAAYLDQASNQLRDQALPPLEALVQTNADRVASSFAAASNAIWFLVASAAALVALLLCHLWLTRRTHRYLNRPLLTGIIVTVVFGIVGIAVFGSTAATAGRVRDESYAATLAVSQAFTSANDAKSIESFTLIKRGSGQTLEEQFQTSADDATSRLAQAQQDGVISGAIPGLLDTWLEAHKGIRAADDGGDWDGAVTLAIATDTGSANAAFDAYSAASQTQISQSADDTANRLNGASILSGIAAWVLLAAGIGAAVLAWRGVSLRLKEYQ
jgi:hypothetical protein